MIEQPFAFQSACATLGFSKCREVRAICFICAGRSQTQTSRIGKKWWKAPPWRKSFRPHKETRTTHPALRKETLCSSQKKGHSCLGETRTFDNCRNTSPPESRAHVRRSGRKGRGGKTIRKAVYGLPGSCLSSWSSLCPTQFPPFWMALAVPSTAFFRSW